MSRADRVYLFITVFLLIAAIAGGIMLAVQHRRNQPVEIVLSQVQPPELSGDIYISGAVVNPGIYQWEEGNTLQVLLSIAGVKPDADLSRIEIHIPRTGEGQLPQKIDINRAKPWLLETLASRGPVLAQRIVDYRSQDGPFRRVKDLLKVSGIGRATLEKIRDYITVSD